MADVIPVLRRQVKRTYRPMLQMVVFLTGYCQGFNPKPACDERALPYRHVCPQASFNELPKP
jgi:hypothetical protein